MISEILLVLFQSGHSTFCIFQIGCQVDLIDMQSQTDGNYRFILVYQDHLTKYVLLKPLTHKRAEEVAYNYNIIYIIY